MAGPPKNRPRMPTPDVTKDSIEKESRFNWTQHTSSGVQLSTADSSKIAAGLALAAHKLATEPSVYPGSAENIQLPVATLQLAPIKELDSGSVNNTLQAGNPATEELAKAIQPTLVNTNEHLAVISRHPSISSAERSISIGGGSSLASSISKRDLKIGEVYV